jgi:hypothetical protein
VLLYRSSWVLETAFTEPKTAALSANGRVAMEEMGRRARAFPSARPYGINRVHRLVLLCTGRGSIYGKNKTEHRTTNRANIILYNIPHTYVQTIHCNLVKMIAIRSQYN